MAKRYGVTVTANISGIARIAEQWGQPGRLAGYLARPEAAAMRDALKARWRGAAYPRLSGTYSAEARFCEKLVAALHAAGVAVVVGSDTPDIPGVPPGASAIDEIGALAAVGFGRFDALAAATRTAGAWVARALPAEPRFGQIARGFRADLVLLDADPLEDLEALRRPRGVVVGGTWLPRETLDAMVRAGA